MADGFIVRKGGVAVERTTAPSINFVSKTDTEIVVTFTNNDAAEAEVYYGITSTLTDTVTLAAAATSSNITFSGLDAETAFTVSAYALVTDPTSKKIKSEIVFTFITTDAGFDPSDLSPQLWLDAADASTITASSGSVSQWNNKGSLSNFTQATSANQPTTGVSTLNGLNVVDFANDFMTVDNKDQYKFLHDGTKYEVFMLLKFVSGTDEIARTLCNRPNGSQFDIGADPLNVFSSGQVANNVSRGAQGTVVDTSTSTGYISINTYTIISSFLDPSNGTATNRGEIRKNGGDLVNNNVQTNAPSSSNPSGALTLFAIPGGARPTHGSLAELIIISGANVSNNNRTEIINYLANKWGITI